MYKGNIQTYIDALTVYLSDKFGARLIFSTAITYDSHKKEAHKIDGCYAVALFKSGQSMAIGHIVSDAEDFEEQVLKIVKNDLGIEDKEDMDILPLSPEEENLDSNYEKKSE